MIVDLRIYTCKVGQTAKFVEIYKTLCWPLQQKYLGTCLGWYTTVEGELNRIVHLWAFENQGAREARRKAMAADPAFGVYLKAVADADVLLNMENRILAPTDFCPPITLT